jgi:hypothetical protein
MIFPIFSHFAGKTGERIALIKVAGAHREWKALPFGSAARNAKSAKPQAAKESRV